MFLRNLFLTNFRNFSRVEIQPSQNCNIFWGNNAQGKTNILEAIYLLSHLKSFRSIKNENLIEHNKSQANITAVVEKNGVKNFISVGLGSADKIYKLNDKHLANTGELIGFFKTVLFAPEEVNLVRSLPARRRALLDRAIFFTAPEYLELARDYQRQLKQRNRLLKEVRKTEELIPWTEGLIINGARLRRARLNYLNRLIPLLRENYAAICQRSEQVDVSYPYSTDSNLEEILRGEFTAVSERERRYQQTLCGPHRDDPLFLLEGKSLKNYGSQGQHRSFMLAFKCAQVMDLEQQTGETPVLLLDDLGSELDPSRRQAFFNFVLQRQGQVFLTTTDISFLDGVIDSSARQFYFTAGVIKEKN